MTAAAALFFLSGAAALVYQVAWQRILALYTGVGIHSIATIVAAFLAGLGLGSHLGGVLSARVDAARALRLFALVEGAVALFGAASPALYYDWLYPRAAGLESPSLGATALHFCALLPPTLLMGMSLPLLVRACVRRVEHAGRVVGALYGVNVLGAATGAMLTPWVLVPAAGIAGAVRIAAAANLAVAAGALLLARGQRMSAAPDPDPAAPTGEGPGSQPWGLWLALYAVSGFCAIALEILWFRTVDVAVKSTAFTFGTVLSLYLLGYAAGTFAGVATLPRVRHPLGTFLLAQCGLLVYAGGAVALLASLPADTPLYSWYVRYWAEYEGFALGTVGDVGTLLRLYVILPLALYGVPTFLMGVSFPLLQRAVHDDVRTSGRKVGALQAANIAGCVAGSLMVALAGFRFLGTAGTLRAVIALGLLFALVGVRAYGARIFAAPLAGLGLVLVVMPVPEALWRRLHGAPAQAWIVEDPTSVVALAPEEPGRWRLSVDGKGHSWIPYGDVHTLLGALPALVHPAPRRVAVVGLGSGNTAWAVSCRRETSSVDVFEISAPQPRLLQRLVSEAAPPRLADFVRDRRIRIHVADGRHALERAALRYDVIQVDAIRPETAYAGNLFSLEFFSACARRLEPGGILSIWGPTPRVVATFARVFPQVLEVGGGQILLGSLQALPVDHAAWSVRLSDPAVAQYLGDEAVAEVGPHLLTLGTLGARGRRRDDLNRDLFPRDEFAVARPSPTRPR